MTRYLGQGGQQHGGHNHPQLRPHAAQHHDGQNQRRFNKGERLRVDDALASGKKRTAKTSKHRAQGKGRELDAHGVQPQRAAGDFILAQRLPGAAYGHTNQAVANQQGDDGQQQSHQVEKNHHVHGVKTQAKELVKGLRPLYAAAPRHLHAQHGGLGDARDAVRPARPIRQVDQQQADDFPKPQGDNRQVIPAQAQHRKAQQKAKQRRHCARQRQRLPKAPARPVVEQGVGISAHGVKAHKAQIQQTGKAHHNVQAERQHDVNQRQGGNIDRVTPSDKRPGGGQQQGGKHQRFDPLLGQARYFGQANSLGAAQQQGLEQLHHKHGQAAPEHIVPMRLQHQLAAAAL